MAKKRIALIGCGIWGAKILRDLLTLDCDVLVFEPNATRAKTARAAGAIEVRADFDRRPDCSGIIVATPSTTHRAILERIDQWGLPIFLEKPLTTNLPDAEALAVSMQSPVFLMHIWLYHRGVLALAELAHSGELGELLAIRSTRANWTSPRRDTDSVWNLIPHDLTIARAILGYWPKARAASVEQHREQIRGMWALLGRGPEVVIEVSNRYERKIRELRLHFSDGVALLENEKVRHLTIYRGDEHATLPEPEYRPYEQDSPLLAELREFIAYLDGGPSPRSDLQEGLEVTRRIDALIRLAQVES